MTTMTPCDRCAALTDHIWRWKGEPLCDDCHYEETDKYHREMQRLREEKRMGKRDIREGK